MGTTVEASSFWHHHAHDRALKVTAAGCTLCLSGDYDSSAVTDVEFVLRPAHSAKETRQLRVGGLWCARSEQIRAYFGPNLYAGSSPVAVCPCRMCMWEG